MLKALELIGFKSFADKTRFEFPEGITVVVGPNGSGKSNIVDAIKWVLGEQSVKSLRGKEMADVIFNGSGARRAMNCAETTLTFDNRDKRLPMEAEEVHVGRRVYRSGEGEYLINGHPSRLRDIRDLFAGTGVSTQAYSIIEQGKVDVLLQSSPRDRRLIFEEAAGISRFKAKKLDAIRRLERVEQNLLRLTDIIDEVDGRLRTVRSQASKARRYKEYNDRLQELRTQVGLTDWRRLTEQLEKFEKELDGLRQDVASTTAEAETAEVRIVEIETEVSAVEDELRQREAAVARIGERIAAAESAIHHERSRSEELVGEIERYRRQIGETADRADDLTGQLRNTADALSKAQLHHQQVAADVADGERRLTDVTTRFDHLREESETRRAALTEKLRDAGQLGKRISSAQAQVEALRAVQTRCEDTLAQLSDELEKANRQRADAQQELDRVTDDLANCDAQWTAQKDTLDSLANDRDDAQERLAELQSEVAAARERASVLEELEQRQEGVAAGVKQVLLALQQDPTGPLTGIRGLVVDVLPVGVEMAGLVEIALAERAGYLVSESPERIAAWLETVAATEIQGRVGVVPLQREISNQRERGGDRQTDLTQQAGVLGRADRFVDADGEYVALAERLLGDTWMVESLEIAISLSRTYPQFNYVSRSGDLVTRDGALCLGRGGAPSGLVSRRSEVRALGSRIETLEATYAEQREQLDGIIGQMAAAQHELAESARQRDKLQEEVSLLRIKVRTAEERQTSIQLQETELREQAESARADSETAATALETARQSLQQVEQHLADLEARLSEDTDEIQELDRQRVEFGRSATLAKVELAKSEQQLDHLTVRMRQFEQHQAERQRAIEHAREQLESAQRRSEESQRRILASESEVAELYLEKESATGETAKLGVQREDLRRQRGELTVSSQQLRGQIRKQEERIHKQDLAAGEVRHQRETLAHRLREDYGIELAELEHEPTDEEQHEREVVEQEIADLRRKINNIGNVNLEALEELEQLENRFADLSTQHDDLREAKQSLERIIERINEDSRRLFIETLETVREHFRELFRKLFGGGQADILIEDDVDILESGLEIMARPPGKEPRSISLLSGGEKTLTCVALLLAIFRSRPSPFCVLDEVDAALDEANIERFIGVLQEFLAWTQFIVVTHSKKTMTSAGTLYGVTMQESGISKRVSVRFEDVTETGEILPTALENDANGEVDAAGESARDDDETQAA
ncbi:MAG: chromosome segregation protein SMC [Planctomycetota bacterium]|nr:MAG: chromosome segregation protein SMC [Planctomycetota bacterium]REK47873.1 MAG: chromosome segregation protein SMC [Planctomycetota bacterium]